MDEPPEPYPELDPELDDAELAKVGLPQDVLIAPDSEQAADALLRHVQALKDDIERYTQQLAEIEAGRADPGPQRILRSALKHRIQHLALVEARLSAEPDS